MRRYAVFFMSHCMAYDVREVTFEDNAKSVMVPIDTRFFFFIQSEEKTPEDVRLILYSFGAFPMHTFVYKGFDCTIENDTLYFIGKRVKDTVINAWAETETEWSLICGWDGSIEIVDSDKLNLQRRKMDDRGSRKEFWGYRDGETYIVALEPDGMVSSISWGENGTDRTVNRLFQQPNELMRDIKVVSKDHPEIYQEIESRIDEKEHEYFRKLADFCREEVNRMKTE